MTRRTVLAGAAVLGAVCLAIVVLYASHAGRVMEARAQAEAVDFAHVAATGLGDRLVAARNALHHVAAVLESGAEPASAGALAAPYFERVTWSGDSGGNVIVHGVPGTAYASLPAGERNITRDATLLRRGAGPDGDLLLIRRAAASRQPGVLIAHLDRDYLARAARSGQPGRSTCALYEFEIVSCSSGALAESARRQIILGRNAGGALRWESNGEAHVAGYAPVPVDQSLGGAQLTVVAIAPEESVHGVARALAWRLAAMIAVAFLVAGLCAWILAARFRRSAVAASGMDTHDPAESRPQASPHRTVETAQPAPERERLLMRVLADIDRAILSRAHLDTVVGVVLEATPQLIDCQVAAVTVLEKGLDNQARTAIVSLDPREGRTVHVSPLDAVAVRALARDPDGCVIDADTAAPFLHPVVKRGAARLLLLPVFVDAGLAGVLAAGYDARAEPDAAARAFARDLADRLGVALTATAREQDAHRHANYDPVTALPNQRLLRERLTQEIARAQREAREFALMYVDLDQFRKVNDSVGHLEGDTVLEQASRRMKRCLREEDVIARFSGDEFVVLLPALARGANAGRVADKLIAALSEPFVVGGVEHYLGASVGISVFPQDGRAADKLLGNANFAMYRAKAAGRSQSAFFDERMNAQAAERAVLERDLRAALANGELHLVYQPQIDLREGRIVGAEALARWNHPRLGPIPPSVFIEIVERNALIGELDRFVREVACAQYQAWQALKLPLPRISVNISGHEILRGGFTDQIRSMLQSTAMRPFSLELEITEGLMLEGSDAVLSTLQSLRELGVRLAIDDFGTGYSSLAYLKKLPFDVLKIDRSFVKDLGTDDGSEGVVNAILGVARSLGKKVIAEGVETESQRAFLFAEGCDCAQGYLWSKPLPAAEFEAFMRSWFSVPQTESAMSTG
ncbi:MAG TPA: EAL domain-containing protein [Burkholderiales bacterium]|nr:EAL domain-containing protein [Burkholderiales bacterium]